MIPLPASSFENGVPSALDWRIVSSKRITPLMWSSMPAVVKRRSRYARRFSSVDSTSMLSKRFLIVPLDSSAASSPFPGATLALAVLASFSVSIRSLLVASGFAYGDRSYDDRWFTPIRWCQEACS
jgi:hypothetical protein